MMLDRRQFLKTAGTGALALGALPPLLECAGIRRRDIPSCESAATCPSLTPEERGILCLASLAPSGHNTQPWTVRKAGNRRCLLSTSDAADDPLCVDLGGRRILNTQQP